MVYCEIFEDYLNVDCSSNLDYVLEQLYYIPHRVLWHDGNIYAVVVDCEYVFDALVALAERQNVTVT